jgi:hypothetical protein
VLKALLILPLGLAMALLPARQAMAQRRTTSVAIVDACSFSDKAVEAHARLRAMVEDALERQGWPVAQGPEIADCGTKSECLAKIARDNGVGYVLRLSGQRRQEFGYYMSLDLYSLATGHLRGAVFSCDMCGSEGVSEGAGRAAADLLAKTAKEEAETREKAKGATPAAEVAALASGSQLPAPAPPQEPSRASWIPWPMMGIGVLAAAYGGWALYQNGRSSGAPFPGSAASYGHDTYSAKGLGIGALVAGGALLVTGVIWVALTPSGSTTLAAAPDRVALNWRF